MFFLLPLLPAFAAVTVSIGEAIGIGASAIGIGAAVKGSVDYHNAKTVQEAAYACYQSMVKKIRQKAKAVQNRMEGFGRLKLETYSGVIREAVDLLLQFKTIDLSPFRNIQVEHITFLKNNLDTMEMSCIRASDMLSCLSVGINTAVNDRIPYKETPPLLQTIGAFGIKTQPTVSLPYIPYAAITMAGISWGLSGNIAKVQAETNAVAVSRETKKMKSVLPGFNALLERISEGENLIIALTGKLRKVLAGLQPLSENRKATTVIAGQIETTITLTKALKQVIETDICTGNGLLTSESGVLFHKIQEEYTNV
jgi:hypothetical protein